MNESYYVEQISSTLERCTRRGDVYNFRCNICGDSDKNIRKKRGYLLRRKDGEWWFHCHNCSTSLSLKSWMKKFFPDHYRSFLMDNLNSDLKYEYKPRRKEVNLFADREELIYKHYSDCNFISILDESSQMAKDAVKFCIRRRIPEDCWNKFLVCTSGKLRNRIIIPYFNKYGKIVFFAARKIYDYMEGVKYLAQIGEKYIYNIDFVDCNKPVIVVEGPVDAMFIENSIAMTGAANSDVSHLKAELYYILDNDETGRKNSYKLLQKGATVFNWKKYLEAKGLYYSKIKDINDLALRLNKENRFKYEDFSSYFTNSLFDSVWFL